MQIKQSSSLHFISGYLSLTFLVSRSATHWASPVVSPLVRLAQLEQGRTTNCYLTQISFYQVKIRLSEFEHFKVTYWFLFQKYPRAHESFHKLDKMVVIAALQHSAQGHICPRSSRNLLQEKVDT